MMLFVGNTLYMQYNARDVLHPVLSSGSNPSQLAEWLFSKTE
jgi:hypothetical protein